MFTARTMTRWIRMAEAVGKEQTDPSNFPAVTGLQERPDTGRDSRTWEDQAYNDQSWKDRA